MSQSDENGFVKRGFLLLGGMTILVAVVLGIIFYKPPQQTPIDVKDLPAKTSSPGWQIRYNATIALLRRGSDQTPWTVVREMLDEKQQLKNCEFPLPDGRTVADEAAARGFVIAALKAVGEWQRKSGQRPPAADVVAAIDQLATSEIPELKIQAEKARQTISN